MNGNTNDTGSPACGSTPQICPKSARYRRSFERSEETSAVPTALEAEAKALEQRLEAYRAWYARMAAEERRLLDALRAHRERWATGNAKGHALSARLSGIRERLLAASRPAQAR